MRAEPHPPTSTRGRGPVTLVPNPRGVGAPRAWRTGCFPSAGAPFLSHPSPWVFVDERGRVVADSTRLNPPAKDRGFNERLIREASEWVFRPATQAGQAVASWFPYQISM